MKTILTHSIISYIKLLPYPVGSYYWSTNSTNPSVLFGGTWESVSGVFMYAQDNDHKAGTAGGANSVSLAHTHTTANHTLTVNEIPSHSHAYQSWYSTAKGEVQRHCPACNDTAPEPKYSTNNTGGGGAHNHGNTGSSLGNIDIMPKYISAYCWRRTA